MNIPAHCVGKKKENILKKWLDIFVVGLSTGHVIDS